MPVTMKDIAEAAKVSLPTVSAVLRNKSYCYASKEKKELVKQIAKEMGYIPNQSAQSLSSGKSYCVGIILGAIDQDLANPFFSLVISALTKELYKHNYLVNIIPVHYDKSFDDEILKIFRSGRIDGYFIGKGLLGKKILNELITNKVPIVSIDMDKLVSDSKAISLVRTNIIEATEQLVKTLKEMNHKSVAYFTPARDSDRVSIFTELAKTSGLSFTENDIFSYKSDILGALVDRGIAKQNAACCIEKLSRYSVIICHSDLVALGLCDMLLEHQIEPGKSISIVGYDNIEENPSFPQTQSPFLATIDPNKKKLGSAASQLLIEQIQHKTIDPKIIEIPARFIKRNSLQPSA